MIHSLYFWFYSRLRSVGIRKSQEINFSHSAPILREPNILTPSLSPPSSPGQSDIPAGRDGFDPLVIARQLSCQKEGGDLTISSTNAPHHQSREQVVNRSLSCFYGCIGSRAKQCSVLICPKKTSKEVSKTLSGIFETKKRTLVKRRRRKTQCRLCKRLVGPLFLFRDLVWSVLVRSGLVWCSLVWKKR